MWAQFFRNKAKCLFLSLCALKLLGPEAVPLLVLTDLVSAVLAHVTRSDERVIAEQKPGGQGLPIGVKQSGTLKSFPSVSSACLLSVEEL